MNKIKKTVPVVERILSVNDNLAQENRNLLNSKDILAINIMASPGSGKTSLILRTIEALSDRIRIGVIEGDTAPVTIDSDKVSSLDIPVVQINTGGECHLDASMVRRGMDALDLSHINLLIIENVGNLVCPAAFRLGEHRNIVVASVPEGDDKPYKYPNIYRGLDAMVLNKIDLLPYVDFDMEYFKAGVTALNPGVQFFELSCKTEEGIDNWSKWILEQI